MTAVEILEGLRVAGYTVRAADGQLRISPASRLSAAELERVRAAKPGLLLAARAREAFDLVAVQRATAAPDLSSTDLATVQQVDRLRALAADARWGAHRPAVRAIVERAVDGGLSEAGASALIGELGGRLQRPRRQR